MLERRRGAETRKLGRLLFFRLLLALFSLAIITITAGQLLPISRYYPAYWLLVGVCFADLVYLVIYRLKGASSYFVTIQIGIDVFFVTALIYLSGASRSSFSVLYYATVLAGASLISRRSAIFFASLATVMLSCATISYFLADRYDATLPLVAKCWLEMALEDFGAVLAYLVAQGVGLHLVAVLAGQLAVRAADVRALYGRILENMSQGILVVDAGNHILYANPEAARLLNFTYSGQIINRKLEEVLPSAQESKIRQIRNLGREGTGEMRFETSDTDAGIKNIEVQTSVLRDSRDRRVGTIILLTDLTLRHRLEETQKRVERLEEIKEMSTGLAHEIRNPLASIRGCTQELGKHDSADHTSQKLVEIVCRESDRLDKIVNDFLNLARMRPLVFSRSNIAGIIDEVVTLLCSREDTRDIQITSEADEKIYLLCDSGQLRQVFLNLGINSLEALDGGGYVRFSAEHSTVGDTFPDHKGFHDPDLEGVMFKVQDNGEGIRPEDVPKVFTPFFTTKHEGTGMGLAIANKIVAEHKGLLEINSNEGEGTTVLIWLPLHPRAALRESELSWIQR